MMIVLTAPAFHCLSSTTLYSLIRSPNSHTVTTDLYADALPMEEWKQEDLEVEFNRRVAEAGLADSGEDTPALAVATPVAPLGAGGGPVTKASIRAALQAEVDKLITPPENWPVRTLSFSHGLQA